MTKMVSIIGDGYLQPIAVLFEKLLSRDIRVDDIRAGHYENGYSVSICVLSALWFESYSMRVRYINKDSQSSLKKNVIEFISDLYAEFPFEKQLSEAFVVRDLIAHNHLWHIDFEWPDPESDNFEQKLLSVIKDAFGGDKKYRQFVDNSKMKTKCLQLNIVPTSINRQDAFKVFRVLYDALIFLEKKDYNQCPVTISQVIFEGKRYALHDFITELERR